MCERARAFQHYVCTTMTKKQPRNEFRKHKKSGHPAYIYEKVGNEFRFLGITHSKIGARIKLEKNPDPDDDKPAYIKINAEQDKENRFGERKIGWKFSPADKKKVAKIVKGNKKRSAPSESH